MKIPDLKNISWFGIGDKRCHREGVVDAYFRSS